MGLFDKLRAILGGQQDQIAPPREELKNPDWAFYERHLRRPVPPAMKDLYADPIVFGGWEGESLELSAFAPISEESVIEIGRGDVEALAFASSVFGDPIYMLPGERQPNTIYLLPHDAPREEPVELANDPAEFLTMLKSTGRRIL